MRSTQTIEPGRCRAVARSARFIGPAFRRPWWFFWQPHIYPQGDWMGVHDFRTHAERTLGDYLAPGAIRDEEYFDDHDYYIPTLAEIDHVLAHWSLPEPRRVPDVFDCDDFAYLTKAQFALHRLADSERKQATAFACSICWGIDIATAPGLHAANIVFAKEGPFFVDKSPGNVARRLLPLPRSPLSTMKILFLVV